MKRVKRSLFSSVLAVIACPALAAKVVYPVQPVSAFKAIAPGDAIVFDIDDAVPAERINNFFLELDGTDVTPSVQLSGRRVTYQPPSRLVVGDHLVKLYEHVGNEKYNEITRFNVRVGGETGDDRQVWGELSGQYNFLLRDKPLDGYSHPDTHTTTAYLETGAVAGGSFWDVSANLDGNFDSIPANNYDSEPFQLGKYLLTGRAFTEDTATTLRLGNHDTGISNLLMNKFYRRGASIQSEAFDHVRVTAFAQDPERTIGDSNVTGAHQAHDRVDGVHAQVYPLGMDQHFFLETAYTDGEGLRKGRGHDGMDNPRATGDGWMGGAEWQGLKDRAFLRGEFAHTRYDFDGTGTLVEPLNDEAVRGRASYALIGDLTPKTYNKMNWSLSLDHRRVGTYFQALTNLPLSSDVERTGLVSDFTDDTLSVVAEGYTSYNNVNDLADIPTDKTHGLSVQASVTPSYFSGDGEGWQWFRYSTFTAGVYTNNTMRDETPVAFGGDYTRYHNSGANAGWNATYENTTFSLTHTYTEYRDKIFSSDNQGYALKRSGDYIYPFGKIQHYAVAAT